jgi:hypothetical protein
MENAISTDDDAQLIDKTQSGPLRLQNALQANGSRPSNQGAWSDLSMEVPNDVPTARVLSFVECVLVELTHEPVGALYRSNEEWGVIETVTIHADWTSLSTDKPYVRFRRDPRTGRQVSSYSYETIRDALVNQLSKKRAEDSLVATDSFAAYPLSTLCRLD